MAPGNLERRCAIKAGFSEAGGSAALSLVHRSARSGLFNGEDGVEERRGGSGGGREEAGRGARGEEMRKQMPALGIDAISSVSQLMTNSAEGKRVERRARSDGVSEKSKREGRKKPRRE